ncbi:MAG: HAD-IA family hydrolase [Spirochaetia bacterium]
MSSGKIDAVIFDFDGTLTRPGVLDYERIRAEIGCPPDEGILRFIESRATERERREAEAVLLRHEQRAAAESVPNHAAEETVAELHRAGFRIAILTRNTRASVERAFENFEHLRADSFELVITRDEGEPLKPDPGSVTEAARLLGRSPETVLMVGDFRDDVIAGTKAGSWTALIRGDADPPWLDSIDPDYVIWSLSELLPILRRHRPLATGKLPNDMLAELLAEAAPPKELLVSPAVGEDVAAVDATGLGVLIAKSDPITFPTPDVGGYAITINLNDLVCSGGTPRWFLATAVFPPETTGHLIREVFRRMVERARREGIAVVGGHTEISDAVTRPVVSGALFGTAGAHELLRKDSMRGGDHIIMTKRPGIEGTTIIAEEFEATLRARSVDPSIIEAAASFEEKLSILPEARLASTSGLAVALHDVTEGGVATALEELATAGNVDLTVKADSLEPYPETATICNALGIDPLGLIGSGSLLIAVRPEHSDSLLERLRRSEIEARLVAEAVEPGDRHAGSGSNAAGRQPPAAPDRHAGSGSNAAGRQPPAAPPPAGSGSNAAGRQPPAPETKPASLRPRVTYEEDGRGPFPHFSGDELARLYREWSTGG